MQNTIVCGGNTNFADYNNNLLEKFSFYTSVNYKIKLIN